MDSSETTVHPLSLRFSRPDLEADFQRACTRRFLTQSRVALVLALILYAVFGALDPFVISQTTRFAWFLRYAIGCPLILLVFALSFTSHFERWVHRAWVGLGLVTGLSLIAMMWRDASPWSHLYYAGLTLICVFLYTFVRLPFLAASVTGWTLVLFYELLAVSTQATPAPVLVSNAIFLLSINIVGMSVCYSMEWAVRIDFLQQRLIGRQAEELRRTLAELETKNVELDSFAYSASHDLKAPLVAIRGLTGMLLEDYGACLDDDGRRLLERVEGNTQHMEHLILDLLALSRIGREAQPRQRVDVERVVGQIVDDLTGATRKGVAISALPLPTLWAVPTHVEQVFANLISNALKYLGDGPDPAVEIGAVDHGTVVEFYVRDSGIGIDPQYHTKVFEIFQRLRDTEAEGTGVGLAIVKKIVDANGGRIWVESAEGCGATFRFTWPERSA